MRGTERKIVRGTVPPYALRRTPCLALALAVMISASGTATAVEIAGWIEAEGRYFPASPLYQGQHTNSGSVAIQPEFYHEWAGGSSFEFTPFYRYDNADNQRTHFDIREAMFFRPGDNYELRAGIGKVSWGVTEANQLVDIINQTDLVESFDGKEKLGQPMVDLTLLSDYGTLDLFLLPWFRERTFQGRGGRLRFDPFIDEDLGAVYESGAEERHVDFAVRYSNTIGNWDIGISNFYGTTRDPAYLARLDPNLNTVFLPFYEIINQTGLDLQYLQEAWLWKLEAIHRSGYADGSYYAADVGFEYTFSGPGLHRPDIGLIVEYLYDSRDLDVSQIATGGYLSSRFNTFMNNDYMLGLRIAFHDAASSSALLSLVQDLDNRASVFLLEASRGIGDNWKLGLDAYAFINAENDPLLTFFRKDSFIQFTLRYYYP